MEREITKRPYVRNWVNNYAVKHGFKGWQDAVYNGSISLDDDTACLIENFINEHFPSDENFKEKLMIELLARFTRTGKHSILQSRKEDFIAGAKWAKSLYENPELLKS